MNAVVLDLENRPRWGARCIDALDKVGIQARLVAAIDGKDNAAVADSGLHVLGKRFRNRYKRSPLPGEIGCYASHLVLAGMILQGRMEPVAGEFPDWFLVFEDDAMPRGGMSADRIREIIQTAGAYDFVLLHHPRRGADKSSPSKVVPATRKEICAHAYLIHRKAAEVIASFKMGNPIDHAIVRCRRLAVGVLQGPAVFSQERDGAFGIYRERKKAACRPVDAVVADCRSGFDRGLGNRLTVLFSAYAAASVRNVPLLMLWGNGGKGCRVAFRDVFKKNHDVEEISEFPSNALICDLAYYSRRTAGKFSALVGDASHDEYWSAWRMAAKSLELCSELPKIQGFPAVHLRTNHQGRKLNDDWKRLFPHPGEGAFLSIDNPIILQEALDLWPGTWSLPAVRGIKDDSERGLPGVIVAARDMMMLSRAKFIIGNKVESSFRNLACIGYGVPMLHLHHGNNP